MKSVITHNLKTDPGVFQETWDLMKKFEIRFDDRNFKVGDEIVLKETKFTGEQMHSSHEDMKVGEPLIYTGRRIRMTIISKLSGCYGTKKGWCIMSVLEIHRVK